MVVDLGWVDWILSFPGLPNSDGNMAEVARQLGQMVEVSNQSELNPVLRPFGTLSTNGVQKFGISEKCICNK